MQIDVKSDALELCKCGHKPTHYTIGYSSTPYYLNCTNCEKLLDGAQSAAKLINAWNKVYRHQDGNQLFDLTKKEISNVS